MADITESAVWEDSIYELATTDPVKGGTPVIGGDGTVVSGHANVQAQKLANRTKYLKQKVDGWPEKVDAAGTALGLITAHNNNPNAHPQLLALVSDEVDKAAAEADRAEMAAESAMVAGKVYPDTTTGLSATTNDQYFSVPSPDSNEYTILYKNNSGTALEVKRYPSAQAVGDLQELIGVPQVGDEFTILDSAGHVVMQIDSTGKALFPEVATSGFTADDTGSTSDSINLTSGENISTSAVTADEVTDSLGLCATQVDAHGRLLVSDAIIKRNFRGDWDRVGGSFDYEINHIIWYGQSWSLGFDSVPAVTTTQKYDTLMFNGGIRQQYSVSDVPSSLQSFEPAVEETSVGTPEFPSANVGETGAVAFANIIKKLLDDENNIQHTEQSYQLLISAPGEGSKSIEQLSDDAQPYIQRVYEQIDRGYAISQSLGKSYAVNAITWMQGANDVSGVGYADQLEALRLKISNYAKTVTGQAHDVVLITWQLMPQSNTVGNQNSARGVYERFVLAADTYPYIICAGPSYQSSMVGSSNVHIKSTWMARIGQSFGLAYKRVVIDGVNPKWQPLRPVSLRRQGSIGILKVNVFDGYLVRDTDQVVSINNDGFNLYDSTGALLTISSVSIIDRDTIKIVSGSAIPSGSRLRYADTGTNFTDTAKWRGNIRDNSHNATGVNRWLVAFSYTFDN